MVEVIDLLRNQAGHVLDGSFTLRDTSPATLDSLRKVASLCNNSMLLGHRSWENLRLSSHEAVHTLGGRRAVCVGVPDKPFVDVDNVTASTAHTGRTVCSTV